MKDVDLKPLEELFRAEVFKMLRTAGKIGDELISSSLPSPNIFQRSHFK